MDDEERDVGSIKDQNPVGKVNSANLEKFGRQGSAWREPEDNSTNHIPVIPSTPLEPFNNIVSLVDWFTSCTDDDAEDAGEVLLFSRSF
ncbi:hypothetical protein Vadar_016881 [Vaccinium darrowii]|uniref:Uncharacterized protein n=1 Tax=Vaccinium darrowii TaxID=229202 RepID=A0ACB7Z4D2_9ERIC|nr:hypothetical protein Vadar_016881 [Vaccinium darrowii]